MDLYKYKHKDMVSLLVALSYEHPDRPLFSFLGNKNEVRSSLSVGQLFRKSSAMAAYIQALGAVEKPVAIIYPHGPDFIIAFFAVILAGAYPMPLAKPRGNSWKAVVDVLHQSNCQWALTNSQSAAVINASEEINKSIRIINTESLVDCDQLSNDWKMPRVEASDIAFIQYTSGSTSKPKGVVITHENIMANSEEIRREFDNKPGDVGVTWLPFFHDMGLIGHIIQPLYTGMLNYFLSPIRFVAQPYLWLEAISKYDGAVSGGPNFGYQLCCEKVNDEQIERLDLSGWKLAYSGSEKINPVTMKDFSRRFVDCGYKSSIFYPCYGLAESTLFVAGTKGAIKTSGLGESEYVAVGKVSKNIKLVSPETNQIIRDGDVGEIYVKSKSIAREYYLNSLASRAIFDQTVAGDRGYVKTGDLGFIKDSNLYFVGRIKNIIKQNGKNFYLEDIESIVHELTRPMLVNRCAAVGLTFDREELVILIELKMKHFSQEAYNLIEIDVSNELRTRIGIVPYAIKIVAPHSIPLTTSGKIKRDKCQELCSKIINTVDGCITWESKVLDTETLS